MSDLDVEGEILAEEDVQPGEGERLARPLPLPREEPGALALRDNVRTAAIAAAGGVLAGAATVAAVRAVGSVGKSGRKKRRLRRRGRPDNVVASRSFLIDVHLLGR